MNQTMFELCLNCSRRMDSQYLNLYNGRQSKLYSKDKKRRKSIGFLNSIDWRSKKQSINNLSTYSSVIYYSQELLNSVSILPYFLRFKKPLLVEWKLLMSFKVKWSYWTLSTGIPLLSNGKKKTIMTDSFKELKNTRFRRLQYC